MAKRGSQDLLPACPLIPQQATIGWPICGLRAIAPSPPPAVPWIAVPPPPAQAVGLGSACEVATEEQEQHDGDHRQEHCQAMLA